jgi:hypothetical protein
MFNELDIYCRYSVEWEVYSVFKYMVLIYTLTHFLIFLLDLRGQKFMRDLAKQELIDYGSDNWM